MQIGVIGAGNMASALVRGLHQPVLVSDPAPGRAEELAAETGGEALGSNAAVAERAEIVFLCHKPAQLGEVAAELDGRASAVASILGGVSVSEVDRAYPETPAYRFMPNLAAAVGRGVFCYARGARAEEGPEPELLDLMRRAGTVIETPDALMDVATALMGCAPAFHALSVEALVDAGVAHGLSPADATLMAVGAMDGAAALMGEGIDPKEVRRRTTSPGGSTARGLAALEAGGLRAAYQDAVDAVVGGRPGSAR